MLTDLGQLSSLLTVAKEYLITDRSWNLLDFLSEMKSLTGKNLTFTTLPIVGYQTIDGQAANVVNTDYIKQVVHEAFYPPAPKPSPTKAAAGKQADATSVPATISSSSPAGGPSSSPSPASSTVSPSENNGASGSAVTVRPNAPYGIPCVD